MKRLIVKNKEKSFCIWCRKDITLGFKIHKRYSGNYHLKCYKAWLNGQLDSYKQAMKELRRELRIIQKHNAQIVLEGLGE